jgi:hypothetical protein
MTACDQGTVSVDDARAYIAMAIKPKTAIRIASCLRNGETVEIVLTASQGTITGYNLVRKEHGRNE